MKDLLVEKTKDQVRIALVNNGVLEEIRVERKSQEKLAGNIYLGRVKNVLPGMQAAFVDIGLDKNGFLYADETGKKLKPGQTILTQVTKEPSGAKGPRLTDAITLPGHMVVLMPMVDSVGISHHIEDEAARESLLSRVKKLKPDGMGLIVRTAALTATDESMATEIGQLKSRWEKLSSLKETLKPPALLHRELDLLNRAVRDMMSRDMDSIKIDDLTLYESAKCGAEALSGDTADKIEFFQREGSLFDRYRVDHQLEKALNQQVWLKSGGYLVFDTTEAMTVVDVNTGKYVGKKSLEETIFALNCEAALEIARQLRLRDIGGIIIIDFIDMESEAHRNELLNVFRDAFKADRTKTNVVAISGLGLVEMTRKKVHQPIHKTLMQTCPVCQGSGSIMSDETVAREALRSLKARYEMKKNGAFLIETTISVAGQLMLIGCPAEIRAFVNAIPGHRMAEYEISTVNEHELPPKSRRIPKE